MFREPDSRLSLLNPGPRSYWCEDEVHNCAAHAREHDDPIEDEEDVVPTKGVSAGSFIVVGNAKEHLRMVACSWERNMDEEEDREEVDGNACKALADRKRRYVYLRD